MREIWTWSLWASAAVAGLFMCIDASFFAANLMKVFDGGYVPLLLASFVYGIMLIWHRGSTAVQGKLHEKLIPVADFLSGLKKNGVPRVPGTAVFMTRVSGDTPPLIIWHVRHNRALHETVFILTVETAQVPRYDPGRRLDIQKLAPRFWHATAHFGFMEKPDIPALLREAADLGCDLQLDDVTYYVGHETVIHDDSGSGLPVWQEVLFAWMERNAEHVTDYFKLPTNCVVEIGRQIGI
jgi:KUP system potassium uptake protein